MKSFAWWLLAALMMSTSLPNPAAAADGEDLEDAVARFARAVSPLSFGAYGDHRLESRFDAEVPEDRSIHLTRMSLLIGYEFADWVGLSTEWELTEGSTGSGEFHAIQLALSFNVTDHVGFRAGRMYIPSSLENLTGEPLTYTSVHTSAVVETVLPSGWGDGAGVYATVADWRVLAYVTNGLDFSQLTAADGFASAMPDGSINAAGDPSWSLRLDREFSPGGAIDQIYAGGFVSYIDGNSGAYYDDTPATFSALTTSVDLRLTTERLVLHGLFAYTGIENADQTADAPKSMTGYSLTAHVDIWPDAWASGKLDDAELRPHVRYESISFGLPDERVLPSGSILPLTDPDPVGVFTAGIAFFPVPEVAVKLDVQTWSGENAPGNRINAGLGWEF